MSFSAKARKVGAVVVIDMSGNLIMGEPTLSLRNIIRRFITDGNTRFILNLGETSYIDSAGLGELVTTYTSIKNKNGDVKLLNLTAKAKGLLQTTKLLTVFDSYDDEQKAIDSLTSK